MAVIFECDNCRKTARARGWTRLDGHLLPTTQWLLNTEGEIVCSELCAEGLDLVNNRRTTPPESFAPTTGTTLPRKLRVVKLKPPFQVPVVDPLDLLR